MASRLIGISGNAGCQEAVRAIDWEGSRSVPRALSRCLGDDTEDLGE